MLDCKKIYVSTNAKKYLRNCLEIKCTYVFILNLFLVHNRGASYELEQTIMKCNKAKKCTFQKIEMHHIYTL